ncbi:MAG: hypothetical protein QOI98_1632 [Solirubrobacteraceae bacterium]|jgi:hypothetical protein|nr:hypothetical protein [Solirubrobacteraceae bacterium]
MPFWRRHRRRSFAPRRPLAYPEQTGLIMVTALAIVLGLVVALLVFHG